jgi:hypothetical protein
MQCTCNHSLYKIKPVCLKPFQTPPTASFRAFPFCLSLTSLLMPRPRFGRICAASAALKFGLANLYSAAQSARFCVFLFLFYFISKFQPVQRDIDRLAIFAFPLVMDVRDVHHCRDILTGVRVLVSLAPGAPITVQSRLAMTPHG